MAPEANGRGNAQLYIIQWTIFAYYYYNAGPSMEPRWLPALPAPPFQQKEGLILPKQVLETYKYRVLNTRKLFACPLKDQVLLCRLNFVALV